MKPAPDSGIDDYIAGYSPAVQALLIQLRDLIRTCLPGATETISYDMPTFRLGETRVYFAGWKSHLAVYGLGPTEEIPAGLQPFSAGKGSLKFPISRDLPLVELAACIRARVAATGPEPKSHPPAVS